MGTETGRAAGGPATPPPFAEGTLKVKVKGLRAGILAEEEALGAGQNHHPKSHLTHPVPPGPQRGQRAHRDRGQRTSGFPSPEAPRGEWRV